MADAIELVLQFFWEGGVEFAYRRWGWFGAAAAFLAPFAVIAGIVAVFHRG